MPAVRVALPVDRLPHEAVDLDAVRAEIGAPGPFPAEVLAEAERAARDVDLPDVDRTDLPFVTIDPPGSTDLDQAVHVERAGSGYRVHYAIADVGAFVRPGGALDAEVTRRGVTLYAPDRRVPLHPPVLGEQAASLLPDGDRPAVLWTLELDADGVLQGTDVRRVLVRSRAKLDYAGVQAALDGGTADESLQLLREVGLLRQQRAAERGAVDLPTPEQEVDLSGDRPRLHLRAQLPVEGWNAQISLLTGTAAAALMLDAGVGLLRTLPAPAADDVDQLRRSALALGVDWPAGADWGPVVSSLDPHDPPSAALLVLATRLLRGAGYTPFDGGEPEPAVHAGVAAAYAHCTAPLRRLADRHVSEACVALSAGRDVPGWVREALPGLPEVMGEAGRRAAALERAVVQLTEAVVLQPCVGERFDAVVVQVDDKGGTVQLLDPPVRDRCDGADLPLGERVCVRVAEADPTRRLVRFTLG
ncbi:MAG: RNB domain-containing ribonuclease [Actinomycetes bacterium]